MCHIRLKSYLALFAVLATLGIASPGFALDKVRLGICTSVIPHGAAPIAIAIKQGWFKQQGIDFELVTLPGSSDCLRNVATGEVMIVLGNAEPVAVLQQMGVKTQIFYTAYRRNIFGLAVPADSPIKTYADLKGKKIGVTSMASSGVVVARSAVADAGLNPDNDIQIVVSGQPAQSVILLRRKDIDAVSQWDTQYALMGLAGVPMRVLKDPLIASFPANSFIATADTIRTKRDLLVRVARGYAMGAIFALKDTRKAAAILQEVYPQIVPTGMSPADALDLTTTLVKTASESWTSDKPGEKWGESNVYVYQSYLDWLLRAKVLKRSVDAKDIVTNELVADINSSIDLGAIDQALAR